MRANRNWRVFYIVILAIVLFVFTSMLNIRANKMCMGVEVVSESFLDDKQMIEVDVRDYILFEDEKVAIDRDDNIIYIPNQISADTKIQDLNGKLDIALNEYELKFIYCEQFDNLCQAVADNHRFKIAAVSQQGYVTYDVVLTTLPVIKMSTGEFMYMKGERDVWEGFTTIWSPYDESMGTFSTKTSRIKFNYRGWTSYYSGKKSYRISFIGAEDDKKNVELLNLGEDDDWVLNAMTMDDTRIKERLCMNLWNQHVQNTDYNYKMAQGEYVEVVADGVYRGVFMLQRRVDPKYLGLSENDILFKRSNSMDYTTVEDGYEIKDTPLTEHETYEILDKIFTKGNYQVIDAQNLADINLFMEWGAMGDNVLKNIYFVLKDTGKEYEMRFILWDTDMTFGIHWTPTGFVYDNISMVQSAPRRPETEEYVKINPDFDKLMAEKWAVLRETVLTEENIQANLDECYNQLISSGVYSREVEKWGCNSYGGADNKEAMEEYIALKLDWMDEKYLN